MSDWLISSGGHTDSPGELEEQKGTYPPACCTQAFIEGRPTAAEQPLPMWMQLLTHQTKLCKPTSSLGRKGKQVGIGWTRTDSSHLFQQVMASSSLEPSKIAGGCKLSQEVLHSARKTAGRHGSNITCLRASPPRFGTERDVSPQSCTSSLGVA